MVQKYNIILFFGLHGVFASPIKRMKSPTKYMMMENKDRKNGMTSPEVIKDDSYIRIRIY
jgi:hypothetical protein